jgi:hypothetical protein
MNILWQWTLEEEFKTNDDRTVRDWKMEAQPAGSGLSHLRDQFGKPALALLVVVALLLLIACTNIASLLLLARGAARRGKWPCASRWAPAGFVFCGRN